MLPDQAKISKNGMMILQKFFYETLCAKNIVAETVVAPLPPDATCQLEGEYGKKQR
jgi:hypothetical protein